MWLICKSVFMRTGEYMGDRSIRKLCPFADSVHYVCSGCLNFYEKSCEKICKLRKKVYLCNPIRKNSFEARFGPRIDSLAQ